MVQIGFQVAAPTFGDYQVAGADFQVAGAISTFGGDFIVLSQNPPFPYYYSETSTVQPKRRDFNGLNHPNSHQKRPNGSRNPLLAHLLPSYSCDFLFE